MRPCRRRCCLPDPALGSARATPKLIVPRLAARRTTRARKPAPRQQPTHGVSSRQHPRTRGIPFATYSPRMVGAGTALRRATQDAALVEAVRSGDVDAFSALYRTHVGAVRAAVRDNVHDAEGIADVVQDTFVRALERLPSLRDPERFRPWLLSIARNTAIDARRVRTRSKTDDGAETDE